jgi:hypothetical protein
VAGDVDAVGEQATMADETDGAEAHESIDEDVDGIDEPDDALEDSESRSGIWRWRRPRAGS